MKTYCKGKKRDGTQCNASASRGSEYCHHHAPWRVVIRSSSRRFPAALNIASNIYTLIPLVPWIASGVAAMIVAVLTIFHSSVPPASPVASVSPPRAVPFKRQNQLSTTVHSGSDFRTPTFYPSGTSTASSSSSGNSYFGSDYPTPSYYSGSDYPTPSYYSGSDYIASLGGRRGTQSLTVDYSSYYNGVDYSSFYSGRSDTAKTGGTVSVQAPDSYQPSYSYTGDTYEPSYSYSGDNYKPSYTGYSTYKPSYGGYSTCESSQSGYTVFQDGKVCYVSGGGITPEVYLSCNSYEPTSFYSGSSYDPSSYYSGSAIKPIGDRGPRRRPSLNGKAMI